MNLVIQKVSKYRWKLSNVGSNKMRGDMKMFGPNFERAQNIPVCNARDSTDISYC